MSTPITIAGRLTRDAELRYLPNGNPLVSFAVAVNKRHRNDAGEWVDGETSFHDVSWFGKAAEEHAGRLEKGAAVIVVGDLSQRRFEDRDGQKRSAWGVKAREVALTLLAPRSAPSAGGFDADPWATPQPSTEEAPF